MSTFVRSWKTSVVVSTYQQPQSLRLVLLALGRQSAAPDEVVVADDGSDDATLSAIRELAPRLPYPILHTWQPNTGFRAARSRNNAILAAGGDYLAFLDQDTLPHRSWLEAHLMRARRRRVLLGLALQLGNGDRERLTDDAVLGGDFESWHQPSERRQLEWQQLKFLYYTWLRRVGLGLRTRPALRSCNASAFRDDLLAVNGFDENYVGWGQEDNDLGLRLYRAGVRPLPVVNQALVSHIPHAPRHADWKQGSNMIYYRRPGIPARCERGIDGRPYADVRVTRISGASEGT